MSGAPVLVRVSNHDATPDYGHPLQVVVPPTPRVAASMVPSAARGSPRPPAIPQVPSTRSASSSRTTATTSATVHVSAGPPVSVRPPGPVRVGSVISVRPSASAGPPVSSRPPVSARPPVLARPTRPPIVVGGSYPSRPPVSVAHPTSPMYVQARPSTSDSTPRVISPSIVQTMPVVDHTRPPIVVGASFPARPPVSVAHSTSPRLPVSASTCVQARPSPSESTPCVISPCVVPMMPVMDQPSSSNSTPRVISPFNVPKAVIPRERELHKKRPANAARLRQDKTRKKGAQKAGEGRVEGGLAKKDGSGVGGVERNAGGRSDDTLLAATEAMVVSEKSAGEKTGMPLTTTESSASLESSAGGNNAMLLTATEPSMSSERSAGGENDMPLTATESNVPSERSAGGRNGMLLAAAETTVSSEVPVPAVAAKRGGKRSGGGEGGKKKREGSRGRGLRRRGRAAAQTGGGGGVSVGPVFPAPGHGGSVGEPLTNYRIEDNAEETVVTFDLSNGIQWKKRVWPRMTYPNRLHRWNSSEEVLSYLLSFDRHQTWSCDRVLQEPPSGTVVFYDRTQPQTEKYRSSDGYAWKARRHHEKSLREDRVKLKVCSVPLINGCYAHSASNPYFHRRRYWLSQNPDIVMVHYLEVNSSPTSFYEQCHSDPAFYTTPLSHELFAISDWNLVAELSSLDSPTAIKLRVKALVQTLNVIVKEATDLVQAIEKSNEGMRFDPFDDTRRKNSGLIRREKHLICMEKSAPGNAAPTGPTASAGAEPVVQHVPHYILCFPKNGAMSYVVLNKDLKIASVTKSQHFLPGPTATSHRADKSVEDGAIVIPPQQRAAPAIADGGRGSRAELATHAAGSSPGGNPTGRADYDPDHFSKFASFLTSMGPLNPHVCSSYNKGEREQVSMSEHDIAGNGQPNGYRMDTTPASPTSPMPPGADTGHDSDDDGSMPFSPGSLDRVLADSEELWEALEVPGGTDDEDNPVSPTTQLLEYLTPWNEDQPPNPVDSATPHSATPPSALGHETGSPAQVYNTTATIVGTEPNVVASALPLSTTAPWTPLTPAGDAMDTSVLTSLPTTGSLSHFTAPSPARPSDHSSSVLTTTGSLSHLTAPSPACPSDHSSAPPPQQPASLSTPTGHHQVPSLTADHYSAPPSQQPASLSTPAGHHQVPPHTAVQQAQHQEDSGGASGFTWGRGLQKDSDASSIRSWLESSTISTSHPLSLLRSNQPFLIPLPADALGQENIEQLLHQCDFLPFTPSNLDQRHGESNPANSYLGESQDGPFLPDELQSSLPAMAGQLGVVLVPPAASRALLQDGELEHLMSLAQSSTVEDSSVDFTSEEVPSLSSALEHVQQMEEDNGNGTLETTTSDMRVDTTSDVGADGTLSQHIINEDAALPGWDRDCSSPLSIMPVSSPLSVSSATPHNSFPESLLLSPTTPVPLNLLQVPSDSPLGATTALAGCGDGEGEEEQFPTLASPSLHYPQSHSLSPIASLASFSHPASPLLLDIPEEIQMELDQATLQLPSLNLDFGLLYRTSSPIPSSPSLASVSSHSTLSQPEPPFDDSPSVAELCELMSESPNVRQSDFSHMTLTGREQEEVFHAAQVIQGAFRKYSQRHSRARQKQAATVIETYYKRYRELKVLREQAAKRIQQHYRMYKCRVRELNRAAVFIQQMYRFHRLRRLEPLPRRFRRNSPTAH